MFRTYRAIECGFNDKQGFQEFEMVLLFFEILELLGFIFSIIITVALI